MAKEKVRFSQEMADEICRTIATSSKGLRRLLSENPHWPCRSEIYEWVFENKAFADQYTHAKARQVEWLVEEALDIAYDGSDDTYEDKGKKRCDHEWVARSRLKVDTIKWFASKLAPKIYGDKLQVEKVDPNTDPDLMKARQTASQLMSDNHGRPSTATG